VEVGIVVGPIVRRVEQSSAAVWLELSADAAVVGRAKPLLGGAKKARKQHVDSKLAHTTPVGGRYYAIIRFEGLQPGVVYAYSLTAAYDPGEDVATVKRVRQKGAALPLKGYAINGELPAFRTLPKGSTEPLRVAFGSCRNFEGGYDEKEGEDTLALYGRMLADMFERRLTNWPHVLLLLGDQIYADDVPPDVREAIAKHRARRRKAGKRVPDGLKNMALPDFAELDAAMARGQVGSRRAGTGGFQLQDFEEFALLYQASWNDPDIKKLFANVPVFMLPDDHSIANGWNITGSWMQQALGDQDWRTALRGGLMAYWLYQGWGNVDEAAAIAHPVLKLIEHAHVGDAIQDLSKRIDQQLDRTISAPVYFTVPSEPPIIAIDARTDREFAAPVEVRGDNGARLTAHTHPDDRMLGPEQVAWLERQLARHDTPIVACSLPLFQTLIGDRLLAQTRVPVSEQPFTITKQSQLDGHEAFVRENDAETWFAFPDSTYELLRLFSTRKTVYFLAGDVHYSYVYDVVGFKLEEPYPLEAKTRLVHAVSSPLRYPENPKRLTALIEYGSEDKLELDRATGRYEVALQVGNKEHPLRDPFGLPAEVFPDDKVKNRYTPLNVIAELHVEARGGRLVWLSPQADELFEVTRYPSE
jgi:phosphodiesterase/alkaline phosphatase D-like protein